MCSVWCLLAWLLTRRIVVQSPSCVVCRGLKINFHYFVFIMFLFDSKNTLDFISIQNIYLRNFQLSTLHSFHQRTDPSWPWSRDGRLAGHRLSEVCSAPCPCWEKVHRPWCKLLPWLPFRNIEVPGPVPQPFLGPHGGLEIRCEYVRWWKL